MENLTDKIKYFLSLYKWLILLSIPVIIFIFLVIYLLRPIDSPVNEEVISPTITPVPEMGQDVDTEENETYENLETYPDFQNKEVRDDGSTVYTFSSENPKRPNISIFANDGSLIFSRELNSKDLPLASISVAIDSLGQPEKIINGSKFYGQHVNIYIYSSSGVAFIGDPKTDEIFEEQHFSSMSIDSYLQRFGNQN